MEETYSKWKSGVITAIMFMQMLELKKNTFYRFPTEDSFLKNVKV
ncbi:integrase [Bacillus toyonensis]|nr:integrase [Bacillus toyonensis]